MQSGEMWSCDLDEATAFSYWLVYYDVVINNNHYYYLLSATLLFSFKSYLFFHIIVIHSGVLLLYI